MISHLIDRCPYGESFSGVIERIAVRALAGRSDAVLMVHSAKTGDFKFPGGGVNPGETHWEALKRELSEECGAELVEIGEPLLTITEQSPSKENRGVLFRMVSLYYPCRVGKGNGRQNLDCYEEALGFTPAWITLEDAMNSNLALLGAENAPPWLDREIWALRWILEEGCILSE